MSSQPTIVIVPGAWQKPVAWDGFQQQLNAAGYPTEYVAMKTVGGTELPLAGLEDDVAEVKAVLARLQGEGKKALLLCHSSGGLVGSNSVEGFDVAGVIYMSAFLIPKGKSLLEMLGGNPLPWMVIQEDRVVGDAAALPQVAFNDLPAEDQARWAKEMTHTSIRLFASPSGYEPWANSVACKYIFCTQDNALPFPIQQQMAGQLGPDAATVTLDASHCPHLSIPDKVVEAIKTLA